MSFYATLTAGSDGMIYGVKTNTINTTTKGTLEFYRDKGRDGTYGSDGWVSVTGADIAHDWGRYGQIVSGDCGVLYAVDASGQLWFFRDRAQDGTADWAYNGVGQLIKRDWGVYKHVVGGGRGILYAVDASGQLWFFRDRAQDGTVDWAYNGVGQPIKRGWGDYTQIACGGDGILYAVDTSGQLWFFRDRAQDGTADWAYNGVGQVIARGWTGYTKILGGGNGILYAARPDKLAGVPDHGGSADYLYYFRDRAQDGTQDWAFGGAGRQIGSGW